MKKVIWLIAVFGIITMGSQAKAMFEEVECQGLMDGMSYNYGQMKDATEDFKPSTYNDSLKLIESQVIKSRNQSSISYQDIEAIIIQINSKIDPLSISDLDKKFYKSYISYQLQYRIRSQNCFSANTYKAYKKLYDNIISNLKKYGRSDLSNSQKITKLEMINDKLDAIDKYSGYKYNQVISYLHIEINKYIAYILRLQS